MKATQYPTRCIPSECHSVSKDKKDSPYLAVVAEANFFSKILHDLNKIDCKFNVELHVVGSWRFKSDSDFNVKILLQEHEVEYFNLIIYKLKWLGVSRDQIQAILVGYFIPVKIFDQKLSM